MMTSYRQKVAAKVGQKVLARNEESHILPKQAKFQPEDISVRLHGNYTLVSWGPYLGISKFNPHDKRYDPLVGIQIAAQRCFSQFMLERRLGKS